MKIVRLMVVMGVLLGGAVVISTSGADAQDNPDLCATGGNLIRNCRFDQGFQGQAGVGSVARGYGGYIISGRPDFNGISCDSPEPPCQRVWSDGELWEAGI